MPVGDREAADVYTPTKPPSTGTSSGGYASPCFGAPTSTSTTKAPGTTSGGGSSGSGTSRAAGSASAMGTLRRYFINLGLPASLATWAYGLLKRGYDMEGVMAQLYGRAEFKKRFPGIFRKDGSLIVSPQEYIQLSEQYRSIATQYGVELNRSQIAKLVGNEVSGEEFQVRARGAQIVQTNPGVFAALQQQIATRNEQMKASGQSPIPQIKTQADALNFVTGQMDQRVYMLYEAAYLQSEFKEAGLSADPGRAREIAWGTAGVMDIEDIAKRVGAIKEQAQFATPELLSYGISQRELEVAQFGGKGQAAAILKIEQALKQRQASFKPKAVQRLSQSEEGRPLAGTRREAGL